MEIGFDNAKYLQMQAERIRERIQSFGGKLYMEFGGKLFDDLHASRVLPGFQPDSKLQLLLKMKDQAEIVVAISAESIEADKMRGDLGIAYTEEILRLIDGFREAGLYVSSVVLTRFAMQKKAMVFEERLRQLSIRTYHLYNIDNYPYDVEKIVSEEGFGKNDWIQTSRPLVVITAPGPGAGKFTTCLSQLYQDNKHGVKSGYAKFETFPIWNIPLKHPINLAYEAATADLDDVNMIDPFHLAAYGVSTVNYNRDIEIFPVLNTIFERIYGSSPYKSPTDMGVNMAGYCISNDEACAEAAKQEIIRRYLKTLVLRVKGKATDAAVHKLEGLMHECGLTVDDRSCVAPCLERARREGVPATAMELPDGRIVTGRTSSLLAATSALILNALKAMAGIENEVLILPKSVLEPVCALKTHDLGGHTPGLHLDEILITLSISALTNPLADLALKQLPKLKGAQLHSSYILSERTRETLRKLGIDATEEPVYETKKLYHAK